jgi:hypothetical protein
MQRAIHGLRIAGNRRHFGRATGVCAHVEPCPIQADSDRDTGFLSIATCWEGSGGPDGPGSPGAQGWGASFPVLRREP